MPSFQFLREVFREGLGLGLYYDPLLSSEAPTAPTLDSMTQSPSPGLLKSIADGVQMALTGTFSDASTSDVTSQGTFSSDDTSVVSVSSPGGLVSYASGGRIYGGQAGVSASIGAITSNSLVRAIAADSGSQLMPLKDSDWTALGLSPWGSYGGLQEGTGSLVLSGSTGGTLAPTATILYGTRVEHWSRSALATFDGANGRLITTTAPPAVTGGIAYLCYAKVSAAAAANRTLMGQTANAALGNRLLLSLGNGNGTVGTNCSGSTAFGAIDHRDDRMHPFMLVYSPVNSAVKAYTDLGPVTGTFRVLTSAASNWGLSQVSTTQGAMSGCYAYFAVCTGSMADDLADDGRASLTLKRLGWNTTTW